MHLLAAADPISHVAQHTIVDLNKGGGIFSFPILSNHIVMQIIAAALLVWLIPMAVQMRRDGDVIGRLVPRGFGNAIEAVCVGLRDQIFQPNLGPYTNRFTPYLWSLFFFILACNILGLIPLADWLPGQHLIGGTATANFWITGTLAALTLVMIVANGLRFHGAGYIKHFFMGPWWIAPFIAFLEVLGLFFKCMALCIRLTANMLAGHVLLAVLLGFVHTALTSLPLIGGLGVTVAVIAASILVNFLEILVAFLHAFIFTVLTAVFLGLAVNIHNEEHEHEAEPAGAAVAAH
jgi:F-type H+-transporting ATPase subunit a